MRLVYVVDRFPSLSETFVLRELQELRRRGDDVTIVSRRRPAAGSPVHDGTETLLPVTMYLPGGAMGAARLAVVAGAALVTSPRRAWPALVWSLRARVRERGALRGFAEAAYVRRRLPVHGEHVHAHFAHVTASVALLVGRLSGVPFSFTAHGTDLFDASHPSLVRRKARAARFVVTVSDYSARYVLGLVDLRDRHKVVVVRNGVETAAFGPAAAERSPALVLTVGRLIEKKGVDLVPAAARLLLDRGLTFEWHIVGDGPLRESLEVEVAAAGVGSVVTLAGPLSHPVVRERLAYATVFVLPCRRGRGGFADALPVVLLEAMAAGVPVVTTPVGGITELVEQDVNGLVVPENDPGALATAVARLLVDAALRERLAAAGRRTADGLELERSVRGLHELFERGPVAA